VAEALLAPSGRLKRLFTASTLCDFGIAIAALIGGVISAVEKQSSVGVFLIILACVVFILAALKLIAAWHKKEREGSPHHLESSLYILHAMLTNDTLLNQDPHLRITLHLPTADGSKLEQSLDYVGDKRGGSTARRRFSVNVGIIGLAFRCKEATVAVRKGSDTEQYVRELVEDWGYTEDDARKRDMSAMTWMAIPLCSSPDNSKVVAIVFLDATDPEFFTEVRQNIALCACVGLAQYVQQAYSSTAR
jgi:hypothetical protein